MDCMVTVYISEAKARSNQGLLSTFECLLWVLRLAIFDQGASLALFFFVSFLARGTRDIFLRRQLNLKCLRELVLCIV